MKRKKFYILITLLITVIIFSTAAICNQLSVTQSTATEKVGVESTTATEITTVQTIPETTATIEATATTTSE